MSDHTTCQCLNQSAFNRRRLRTDSAKHTYWKATKLLGECVRKLGLGHRSGFREQETHSYSKNDQLWLGTKHWAFAVVAFMSLSTVHCAEHLWEELKHARNPSHTRSSGPGDLWAGAEASFSSIHFIKCQWSSFFLVGRVTFLYLALIVCHLLIWAKRKMRGFQLIEIHL